MPARSKAILARASRVNRRDGPIFLIIENDPEIRKLGLGPRMASNRQARIGEDYYQAAPEEATAAFHARLRKMVRGQGGPPFPFILLGHPSNIEPLKEPSYSPTVPN